MIAVTSQTEMISAGRIDGFMLRALVATSVGAVVAVGVVLMKQHGVKSLVVTKRDEHDAYGLITYTNILKTIIAEEGDIDLINVYDVCAKPALTVSRELDVKYAARLMVSMDIHRLLVTTANELVGIVTMTDIVSATLNLTDDDLA